MIINVEELRKGPKRIEVCASAEQLRLCAEEVAFPAPVTGEALFQMVGSRVLATGRLATRVECRCVRCLAAVEYEISAPVELVFEKRPPVPADDANAAVRSEWDAEIHDIDYYDEDTLDPGDLFRQIVLLALPDYPLCRTDCRGLCRQCGANLNKGGCRCNVSANVAVDSSDWRATLKKVRSTLNAER
ncbi:DUF177 domain-containing protein [Candidatus Sumerlaeota bacterium]|nr:DUF177 domain-containing protein [Candidatus Sumerlaeota bacterium]